MGDPSGWQEAGDRSDGTGLRTPALDAWSWGAMGAASSAVCVPFVQLAMLARVPLLFRQRLPGTHQPGGGGTLAFLGAVAALVPIGAPLVALSTDDPDRVRWAWTGVALVVATLVGHAEISLRLSRLETGTRARRIAGPLLTVSRVPVALCMLAMARAPDAPLPVAIPLFTRVTPAASTLAVLSWLDLALGAAAAVAVVTLLRQESGVRRPSDVDLGQVLERWQDRMGPDADVETQSYAGGTISRGTVSGRIVAVDLTATPHVRAVARVTLPTHPLLDALRVVGRGEEPADVPLHDPILQRMVRVSGVSEEDASALLGDLHGPLFDVLRAHEDSRVGGGCVVAVAEPDPSDPGAFSVEAVLGPALLLADALTEAASRTREAPPQTSQDTGSTPGT